MFTVTNFLEDNPLIRYEVSDARELIDRQVNSVTFYAGGFQDTTGSHYSRMKSEVALNVGEKHWLTADIEIPADFYTRHQASMKVMTFGTATPYKKIGLWIDSAGFPRLQFEDSGLKLLWQGTEKLPVGRHFFAIECLPSPTDGIALTRLYMDGTILGESTLANFNGTVLDRLVWGIDGAANQDTNQISLIFRSAGLDDFQATPEPPPAFEPFLVEILYRGSNKNLNVRNIPSIYGDTIGVLYPYKNVEVIELIYSAPDVWAKLGTGMYIPLWYNGKYYTNWTK